MRKKLIALLLCAAMVLSNTSVAAASDSASAADAWIETSGESHYSVDSENVVTSDGANIGFVNGTLNALVLNDFSAKTNYTVSATVTGTMNLPNTKYMQMGLVPYYVDNNNYLVCYLDWSDTERITNIREVQFTGYINGNHIGWNDTWMDGKMNASTEGFDFEITRDGNTFAYKVSIGSQVLCNNTITVEGLAENATVGVMAVNDAAVFSDFTMHVEGQETPPVEIVDVPKPLAYWSFDGDGTTKEIYEDSIMGLQATNDGAVSCTGKFGQGLTFDGSSMLQAPWSQLTGNAARTISLWYKIAPADNNQLGFFLCWGSDAGYQLCKVGVWGDWIGFTGSGFDVLTGGAMATANDEWHHLAMTLENDTMIIYIDGEPVKTQTGASVLNTAASDLYFGAVGYRPDPNGREYMKGSLDEVYLFDSALTQEQIKEVMKNTFVEEYVKEVSAPVSYWGFNSDGKTEEIYPDLISGNDAVNHGATSCEGKYGSAVNFNGSSMLQAPWSQLTGASERTISLWYKIEPTAQGQLGFFISWGNDEAYRLCKVDVWGDLIGFTGSWYDMLASGAMATEDGTWHHLAFTFDGDLMALYIDGKLVKTQTGASAYINTAASDIYLGAVGHRADVNGREYMNGSLDEVYVFDEALTYGQIQEVMKNTFVEEYIPEVPCPISYWNFDSEGVTKDIYEDHISAHDAVNDGAVSCTGKYGSAVSFNGSSMLQAPWSQLTGNDERTIALWYKIEPTDQGQLGFFVSWGADGQYQLCKVGVWGDFIGFTGSGYDLLAPGAMATEDGAWHHLAFTFDGDKLAIYIDGVLKGTLEGAKDLLNTAMSDLYIGAVGYRADVNNREYMKGALDEVCIFDTALSPVQIRMVMRNDFVEAYGYAFDLMREVQLPEFMSEQDYLDVQWDAYIEKVEEGQAILDTLGEVSESEVSAKAEELKEAREALVKVDVAAKVAALQAEIDDIKADLEENADAYLTSTVYRLKQEMQRVEDELSSGKEFTATEIIELEYAIHAAKDSLTEDIYQGEDVPLLYISDLYHPHDDLDDHFDIATIYALPRVDLLGVVINQGGGQERANGIPVEQLNALKNVDIPYFIGSGEYMTSVDDTLEGVDCEDGIEFIIETLENTEKPVMLMTVGSAREIAAAYNRNPELFTKENVAGIMAFIGNGSEKDFMNEWNINLDPMAFVRLMEMAEVVDFPIYLAPCFDSGDAEPADSPASKLFNGNRNTFWTARHDEILDGMTNQGLWNFFYYMWEKYDPAEVDPIEYLATEEVDEALVSEFAKDVRSLWCTAIFGEINGSRMICRDSAPTMYKFIADSEVIPEGWHEEFVYGWQHAALEQGENFKWTYKEDASDSMLYIFVKLNGADYAKAMTQATADILQNANAWNSDLGEGDKEDDKEDKPAIVPEWVGTAGSGHYDIDENGVITSDDAFIFLGPDEIGKSGSNFYILDNSILDKDYTVSVTAKGTMGLPNTKDVKFGLVPYYVDDNNFIMVYVEYSVNDRPTDIRCVQFTGVIDGKHIGWNDYWQDGVHIPSSEEFDFEVTRDGNKFTFTVSVGDQVLASGTHRVSGLEDENKAGVMACGDEITFTDYADGSTFETGEDDGKDEGDDGKDEGDDGKDEGGDGKDEGDDKPLQGSGTWTGTADDVHYTIDENGVIKSDDAFIFLGPDEIGKSGSNFFIRDAVLEGKYTVSVTAQGTMGLPNTKDVKFGLVPYYVDDNNFIIVYVEYSTTDRATDIRCVQFTGIIDGKHIGWNDYWQDGVQIPSTEKFDFKVTRDGDYFKFTVKTGNKELASGTHKVSGLADQNKAGVMACGDVITFTNYADGTNAAGGSADGKEEIVIKQDWVGTSDGKHYSIDANGVIKSDDAFIFLGPDEIGKSGSNFYILDNSVLGKNYTVSVTAQGSMKLPNTKDTKFGLVPYYVDDNNFIMVYVEYSASDRPNEIRCIQFTGIIDGKHIGWNDYWQDGVSIPSNAKFKFSVTRNGDAFTFKVTADGKELATGTHTVKGLQATNKAGVMACGDVVTFTGYSDGSPITGDTTGFDVCLYVILMAAGFAAIGAVIYNRRKIMSK